MLTKPPLEKMLPKVESRYTLAMLVAKRTRQLVDGAQPMVDSDTPNLVTLACEEIASGSVVCVKGIYTPVVPLRPEVEEARRLAREMAENQAAFDAFPEFMDLSNGAAGGKNAGEDAVLFTDLPDNSDGSEAAEDSSETEDENTENPEGDFPENETEAGGLTGGEEDSEEDAESDSSETGE